MISSQNEECRGSAAKPDVCKPRILLVDDDITVRQLGAYHLTESGFEVMTLSEALGVRENVREFRPDAVLMDVMLPDGNGLDLCRQLRGIPEAGYLPIIMLTSLNDEDAIRTAFESGATEFVVKPVNWLQEIYRLRYTMRAAATLASLDRAKLEILRAKQEWEQTFNAIEDPVVILNSDMTIRQANLAAARMSGTDCDGMLGCSCSEVFACGLADSDDCPTRIARSKGGPVQTEVRGFGPERRDCLISVAPVPGDNASEALVYSIKDITEYHELQEELLQSQKMEAVGALSAGVAHDFNNLLQGVLGWADLLGMGNTPDTLLKQAAEQMTSVAERGRALTRQLLFAAHEVETERQETDIGELIGELGSLLSRTQPKTVEIELSVAEELWKVDGNASHLHQALMNLAVNAGHAMPNGGQLCITARNVYIDSSYDMAQSGHRTGRHVLIEVRDSGEGIPKELQARIYDPFFTTKPQGKGTGLGLSIVFGVVKDHGGHISCSSEEGKGTAFRIYLPATGDEPNSAGEPEVPESAAVSGEGKTVLVAEDEPSIMQLLVRNLENEHYKVVQTVNGKEALDRCLALRGQLDAIILDMNMPVMNGESCIQELCRNHVEVPLIIATGSLLSEEEESKLRERATDIIHKPYRPRDLLRSLGRVLSAA